MYEIQGVFTEQLCNILDEIAASVYLKDTNGKYLACNRYMLSMVGEDNRKNVIGKTDRELIWKDIAPELEKIDKLVIKNKIKHEVEETPLVAAGDKRVYLTTKSPLYDSKREVIGIIGVSIDITDRKKSEEELKQAKEAAELASKAKTDFMYNMRHDIRTALSGIQGFSELIKDEAHDKKISEYAENLVASCRALTNIHNQILHAIHVFSGDIPNYKNKFDLCGKLQQIINLNLAKACEKGLKLTLNCDTAIPKYLVGDCKRLTGIALELITNALKYTDAGSVSVKVALEKKQDAKVTIKFSVQDTGIGITDDKKQEIFNRFSRVNLSYEGKYIGLGLGLSIVKQFIEDLGGEIYVNSELQKGSTFVCYLPFIESLSTDNIGVDETLELPLSDISIRASCPLSKTIPKSSDKSNLLLVEDDEICAKIAQSVLESLGHKVDIARTGEEALQKTKINSYDLIFMDVGLPDINGNEVTRKIRIEEKTTDQHVPIIALTAHIDSESKQQCVESGMDAVLSKPIVKNKIAEILNAFIPRQKIIKQSVPKVRLEDKDLLVVSGEIIDFDYMKKNFNYNKNDARFLKILEMVQKLLPENIKLLQQALQEKDWQNVGRIAHKISGSVSYCGALRAREACHRLDVYIMAKKTKLVNELSELALKECESLLGLIKNLLK